MGHFNQNIAVLFVLFFLLVSPHSIPFSCHVFFLMGAWDQPGMDQQNDSVASF